MLMKTRGSLDGREAGSEVVSDLHTLSIFLHKKIFASSQCVYSTM